MSLINFQTFLVYLYTNRAVRDSFAREPDRMLASYDLDEKEKQALVALNRASLDIFCASLTAKKKKILKKMLSRDSHIVLISPWYVSRPALFMLEGGENSKLAYHPIDNDQFLMLKTVQGEINFHNVMRHWLYEGTFSFQNIFKTIKLVHSRKLWGKHIKVS